MTEYQRTYDIIINILKGRNDADKMSSTVKKAGKTMGMEVDKMGQLAQLAGMSTQGVAESVSDMLGSGNFMMGAGGVMQKLTPLGKMAGAGQIKDIAAGEGGWDAVNAAGLTSPMSDKQTAGEARTNAIKQGKILKGFQYQWLSLMFVSKQLSQTFSSMLSVGMETFGINKLLNALMLWVIIPLFQKFAPLIYQLIGGIFALAKMYPEAAWWIRFFIGVFILAGAAAFGTIAALTMLALAVTGFATAVGVATSEVWIPLLVIVGGVFLAFVGLILIIGLLVEPLKMWLSLLTNPSGWGSWMSGGGPKPFASGGIVRQPTLAMIGESGPEMVVPLGSGSGGVGGTVNINANVASNIDITMLARRIYEELQILQAQNYSAR